MKGDFVEDNFDINNETHFAIDNFNQDFINIFNKVKETLKIIEPLELTLNFVDEQTQVELNKKYCHKDYVADVLTFALEENEELDLFKLTGLRSLGDIFICYPKAVSQAAEYQHSLRRELAFLFTHGILHILGYDHQTKQEEEIMFNLQRIILNDLQILRNPIE
ncbi:metalloprotease [Spiroplasma atrichopogonis]|nr:hypothetical protein SMM_0761 [Spiroplasma mirum ATCC 29335]AKM53268.1 metalloprotease [Spiroplasma atrichopogonis]